MVTIKDLFGTDNISVGQNVLGGVRFFASYNQCASGQVDAITDDCIKMSGNYDVDEKIEDYHFYGKGTFEASLTCFPDGHWEASGKLTGLYEGKDTVNMIYKFEDDYHVFDGKAGHYQIVSQTWADNVDGRDTFHVYATVIPYEMTIPTFYISLC